MQQAARRSSVAAGMGLDWLTGAAAGATADVGSPAGATSSLGYGQAEHAHMMTAIRQPLFIQTPLQVMLETLVEKLQLQADAITGMQGKLDSLERNKLTGAELLSRIQLLESRVDAATAVAGMCASPAGSSDDTNATAAAAGGSGSGAGSFGAADEAGAMAAVSGSTAAAAATAAAGAGGAGFSPFAQARLVKQVAALEQQAAGLQASSAQLAFRTEQVLLPRLQQCEQRLAGVSNLAGALMAVEQLAAEVGITVPHPPLSALTMGQEAGSAEQPLHSQHHSHHNLQPQQPPQQQAPGGGVLTLSRQQLLQQQIDAGKEQAAAMQQHLQRLQQQVDKLSTDAAAVQDQQLGVLAGLQDSVSGLSDKLTQQVALLRREFKPALQAAELQQVSAAEVTRVARQMEALEGRQAGLAKELAALKTKEFAELAASVAQLGRRVARVTGAPGALSDTERALAAAQAELRCQVEALSARLTAHEAAEVSAGAGVATQQDLQELSALMRGRASQEDMRSVVNRAVGLALQAHRESGGLDGDGAAASRSRSLRDGSPPRCSTAPQPQQQQSLSEQLLPLFDAFRPATALPAASATAAPGTGGSGPGAGSTSSSSSGPQGRTGSPGRPHGAGPGASAAAGGVVLGPLGPGLYASQLRQLSAHKAGRLGACPAGGANSTTLSSSSSSHHPLVAAGGVPGGILGLMPGGGEGPAGGVLSPGPDGLFVADLVSSNLHISSAPSTGPAAAAGAPAAGAAGTQQEASFSGGGGVGDSLGAPGSVNATGRHVQQQQEGKGGFNACVRPQTAAAVAAGSRDGRIAAGRPSTAAVAGNRPGTAAASGSKAAAGKRTPVFI